MAMAEPIVITESKKKGFVGQWLEKNDSRIKDLTYSARLFAKSPLALLGLGIILLFVILALATPYIAPYGDNQRNWYEIMKPPRRGTLVRHR